MIQRTYMTHHDLIRQRNRYFPPELADICSGKRAGEMNTFHERSHFPQLLHAFPDIERGLFFACQIRIRDHEMSTVKHKACMSGIIQFCEKVFHLLWFKSVKPRPEDIFKENEYPVRDQIAERLIELCRRCQDFFIGMAEAPGKGLFRRTLLHMPDQIAGLLSQCCTDIRTDDLYPAFSILCAIHLAYIVLICKNFKQTILIPFIEIHPIGPVPEMRSHSDLQKWRTPRLTAIYEVFHPIQTFRMDKTRDLLLPVTRHTIVADQLFHRSISFSMYLTGTVYYLSKKRLYTSTASCAFFTALFLASMMAFASFVAPSM